MPRFIYTKRHPISIQNHDLAVLREDDDFKKLSSLMLTIQGLFIQNKEFPDSITKELERCISLIREKFTIEGEWNDSQVRLHERGLRELEKSLPLLNDFLEKPIQTIVASPYFRTLYSAEYLKDTCSKLADSQIVVEPRFQEQNFGKMWMNFEIYFALHIEEFRSFVAQGFRLENFWKAEYLNFRFPGGECTVDDVRARVIQGLSEQLARNADKNILLLGHETVTFMISEVLTGYRNQLGGIVERREVFHLPNSATLRYEKAPNGIYDLKESIYVA